MIKSAASVEAAAHTDLVPRLQPGNEGNEAPPRLATRAKSHIMSGCIGNLSRGGFIDISRALHELIGKTRPYNIKKRQQPTPISFPGSSLGTII
ncbi:MAG TPA: hypothetical protein DDW76_23265 [Cyanobacteria bacterium UBA11369]|nr:hypothetical protein [Cyanobacteria bacterium UBA11371]HBE51612.1 hypothetical protein [Cyanobacteria bacterium UBA11369]